MPLRKLWCINLGPFDEIEFEFDEHVNVFTGPNNSGKSTALITLGEITVFPFILPRKLLRAEAAEFRVELDPTGAVFEGHLPIEDISQAESCVPLMTTIGYSSFLPAIRRSTDFRAASPIVTKKHDDPVDSRRVLLRERAQRSTPGVIIDDSVFEEEEFRKRERLIHTDAISISDEAVVQKIVELDYRAYRKGIPEIRSIIDKTAAIVSDVTEGYPIRFERVEEDDSGLFPLFRTPDGALPLNVLSQGTQSLIQWLAHLLIGMAEYYEYPKNIEEISGILIIDEIDAHLHPSWQRRIIPALTNHFPNLQIFCSTHSPLMLAGLKTGQVQLLKRDDNGKVTVSRNEQDIVGWSADEILRSFLNVSSPTDLDTLHNIERLQQLRQTDGLTDEQAKELDYLGETVRQNLLGGPLAAQLEELRSILGDAKAGNESAPEPKTASKTKGAVRRSSSSRSGAKPKTASKTKGVVSKSSSSRSTSK